MVMTGRPVNIQATRKAAMKFRGETLAQPYVTLIENTEDA
jgi:CRISPR/Cas system-associated protein endoribonuclease Cas2